MSTFKKANSFRRLTGETPRVIQAGLYFGITLMKIAADTLSGAWHKSFGPFPLWFFWVAVPAYWIWGLGMGTAAVPYYRVTRPQCRICGQ